MSRKPAYMQVRVLRAFYTWHPDFLVDDELHYQVLPTGKWIAEWTIRRKDCDYYEHYIAQCTSEHEAKNLIDLLESYSLGDSPWRVVHKSDTVFTYGKLKSVLSRYNTVVDGFSGAQ